MPVILTRLLRHLVSLRAWVPPAGVMLAVFVTSWPLMALAEPADTEFTQPGNYWWWFLVTASTVGYGDFYPVSTAGQVVGVYVIIGGIATITTLFTQLASVIDAAKGRRMRGQVTVDASDHIVVLGYTPGRTEGIVDEMLGGNDRTVVLCAWDDVDAHPLHDRGIDFVRGDLTDAGVLRRAGVHRASGVLVDARDDNEALAIVVTVNHITGDIHLVAGLRNLEHAARLRYVNDDIRCIQWHNPRMLTEELESPGITRVYEELMTHGGQNTYSVRLPEAAGPIGFGDCQAALGREHEATVLAARVGQELLISPAWQTSIPGGSTLYYVSMERITPEQLTHTLRVSAAGA